MRLNQTHSKSGSAKSLHSNSSTASSGTGSSSASGAASAAKSNSVSRNREVKLLPASATVAAASGTTTAKPKGLHQLSNSGGGGKLVLNPQNQGQVARNPTQHRSTPLLKAGATAEATAAGAGAGSSSLGLQGDLMSEKSIAQSRRVLEEIQKTKSSLLKQQQQQLAATSSGSVPVGPFAGPVGSGSAPGSHFPQLQIPSGPIPSNLPNPHSPSVIIGNPIDPSNIGLSPIQRSALHLLQQANQTSFGSYISTDSHFGNGIFPVLPRLVNNSANSNSNSSGNSNSGGNVKIT